MEIPKNTIIILLFNKMYQFKSSYKCAEFFNNADNIIEGITDEIKFILSKPHIINRVLKCVKGDMQQHFIKNSTKKKYCQIPNFTINRV